MNRDLNLTEEVQHYKQTLVAKSLLEVRRTLPQMWLQKKSPNMQKGNDDKEAIITKELKSHLKGLI